jgi:hypothetical protein
MAAFKTVGVLVVMILFVACVPSQAHVTSCTSSYPNKKSSSSYIWRETFGGKY